MSVREGVLQGHYFQNIVSKTRLDGIDLVRHKRGWEVGGGGGGGEDISTHIMEDNLSTIRGVRENGRV